MMPLVFGREGEELEIVSIETGKGAASRLQEMGIYPGVKVRVISNSWGPMIIGIGSSRIALGRGLASKVVCKTKY
jgi:ferrous iron transport protein A